MLRLLAAICALLLIGGSPALASSRQVVTSGDRYGPAAAQPEGYRLGTGDVLRVTVFNEPTLSGDFSVAADGSISLPLIGKVSTSGRTPDEVATAVRTQLADGYLRSPTVSAEVTNYRPFYILGEVKAPGQYPYTNGLTAYNAIATAQGFTPRAERRTIYIRKAGSSEEEAYRLAPDLRILPGDTLRLGERYF